MAHVVLKDLVKSYGQVMAVDNVSLTVGDGEFVALVGPSGCGKTTTLNLIAGLLELTDGEIYIGDRQVNDLDPKDRDIAMVFQNYALYPQKSVYKNLAFPLQMRKLPRDEIDKKVKEAARVLDMTHLLERKPRELSGGSGSVWPWAALVRDPAVFLMDEPLSNLDAKLRVRCGRRSSASTRPEGDHHLCDARPARSRDHGRQDGGDERRLPAAI
jgi:multiple sugar transport system ATP-binding protein